MDWWFLAVNHNIFLGSLRWAMETELKLGSNQRLPNGRMNNDEHPFVHWDVYWLVVSNMAFIFHNIWDNHPNWLIFFRGVETTNQFIFTISSPDFANKPGFCCSHGKHWTTQATSPAGHAVCPSTWRGSTRVVPIIGGLRAAGHPKIFCQQKQWFLVQIFPSIERQFLGNI